MFLDELKKRNVPSLKSRAEMLELLQREEYGCLPKAPESFVWEAEPGVADNFCAGKATLEKLTFRVVVNGKDFVFPVYLAVPTAEGPHPFFVHINFRSDVPDRYMPTEELIDNGFAVLSFGYEDVTRDDGDFTSGLAGVLYENGKRAPHDAGKIALWAWAAMRCMDYAEHDERLDCAKSVVCGHSRLGKTALLTAALDTRFAFGYSNDSGCAGAALFRGKKGEQLDDIYRQFPFWFSESFGQYVGKTDALPFDQHYLLASIAPRYVYVASAAGDDWADPASELLSCYAAAAGDKEAFPYEETSEDYDILTCTRAASAIIAAPVCTISAARTGTGLLRFLKAKSKLKGRRVAVLWETP